MTADYLPPPPPEFKWAPETVGYIEADARHAVLVRALVSSRDDLRRWLRPDDGQDGPDAHTIARALLAALDRSYSAVVIPPPRRLYRRVALRFAIWLWEWALQ